MTRKHRFELRIYKIDEDVRTCIPTCMSYLVPPCSKESNVRKKIIITITLFDFLLATRTMLVRLVFVHHLSIPLCEASHFGQRMWLGTKLRTIPKTSCRLTITMLIEPDVTVTKAASYSTTTDGPRDVLLTRSFPACSCVGS